MKKNIPNIITLLNLLCGSIALVYLANGAVYRAVALVGLGAIFDFLDGMVARLIRVDSPLGKQLDSLADVVSFGVVPGLGMTQLIESSLISYGLSATSILIISGIGWLITLGAAWRLAKFNIDSSQQSHFVGLPTPANAFFILSLLMVKQTSSIDFIQMSLSKPIVVIGLTLLSAWILNAPIRLFALKFNTWNFAANALRYIFLLISIVLIVSLGYIGVSLSIILYILISLLFRNRV